MAILFQELEPLTVSDIFEVQCKTFWFKFVKKSPTEYIGTMFTLNNEFYQIETRGQLQLHLFSTRTISARNVLMPQNITYPRLVAGTP